MPKKSTSLRSLLATEKPLIKPGAHDVISARLAEMAGFKAIAIGGLALLASQRGLPDIGLAALTDMVDAARNVIESVDIPCGVDGDDGYGDIKSVARTVMAYEKIGVGSVIFEDQDLKSKRPGDARASRVIPADEMVKKLRAAVATREDREMLILSRCDAYGVEGFDGVMRRAELYLKAGADGIFVSALPGAEELRRVGEGLRGALQMTAVTERLIDATPSPAELYAMGFGLVVYPQFVTIRMVAGAQAALGDLSALAAGKIAPSGIKQLLAQSEALQTVAKLPKWLDIETKLS